MKLYIVGIPIDYQFESRPSTARFRQILLRAKSNKWSIYAYAPPKYFQYLTPDGWKTIQGLNVTINYISNTLKFREQRFMKMAEDICALAQKSQTPLVSLHPGDPRLGDLVFDTLLKRIKPYKSQTSILPAKSGIDIVGDMAEKYYNKKNLKRTYMDAQYLIREASKSKINSEMLLVHCLASEYDYGRADFFGRAIIQLFKFGLGDKPVYLKSPGTKGVAMRLIDLVKTLTKYNPLDYYTLAIIRNS